MIRCTFRYMMEKDRRKSNLRIIKKTKHIKIIKRNTLKWQKNNIRKSPEDARKYVGSDIREARAEQVNLIKVGRFWWFLRNSRQHATAASHWIENCSFSDVTAGCATILGHVRISPLLIFSRIFVPCFEIEFQIRFSLVFFHHMTKSTSDRWSTPLNKKQS